MVDVPDRAALALPAIPGKTPPKARELAFAGGEVIVPRIWFNFREAAGICVRVLDAGKHKGTRVARLPRPRHPARSVKRHVAFLTKTKSGQTGNQHIV